MERRIYEAAVEGSVISLLNLLQEDALVLDRVMVGCHPDTPLHIASMLGHLDFVQEILNRKPEMAGELDARKSSPLHLATAKGYLEIVKKLVLVNPEMCSALDRDGRNPLHIATIKGHFSVLRELVNVKPQAARMVIDDRGETILHLCVRYSQLEMLKLLVETIGENGFLNSKCHEGNTILHTAAADKQVEIIKYLITKTGIEVNALNAYGFTSLDLLTQSSRKDEKDWEIAELLQRSGAMHTKDIHLSEHGLGTMQMPRILTSRHNQPTNNALQPQNKGSGNVPEKKNDWAEKMTSALMVVASLIATMAFQVAIDLSGAGDPQSSEGPQPADRQLSDYYPTSYTSGVGAPQSLEGRQMADRHFYPYNSHSYALFLNSNTTAFMASLSIIVLLISGLPIRHKFFVCILMVIMWIAISAMILTYLLAISTVTKSLRALNSIFTVLYFWIGLVGLLLLVHIIRLIAKRKYVRKLITQCGQHSSNEA